MSRPVARGAALAAVLVLLLAVPRLAGSYVIDLLFTFFLYAVLAQGWNLLAGYCGLLSFGSQVFIGIGGFAVAVLCHCVVVLIWLALPLAGVVAALLAYLIAIPINGRRARRLAPDFAAFRRQRPHILVDVITEAHFVDLERDMVDLPIRLARPTKGQGLDGEKAVMIAACRSPMRSR